MALISTRINIKLLQVNGFYFDDSIIKIKNIEWKCMNVWMQNYVKSSKNILLWKLVLRPKWRNKSGENSCQVIYVLHTYVHMYIALIFVVPQEIVGICIASLATHLCMCICTHMHLVALWWN